MRDLMFLAAFALVFVLAVPAGAQPFADTPTNHWAYDAIAELAVKGLIEGYPEGTFKGDRAMTRYEMAMVVARLLARIESIQIPTPAPPPKPEVTKADIDMILRLANEFRAELAAKNVRLTAVEEELNAIKAKLDNVRITGGFQLSYQIARKAFGASVNGNPNAFATDASMSVLTNQATEALRLSLDGNVAKDFHLRLALLSNGTSGNVSFNSAQFGPASKYTLLTVDNLFFDWENAFGWSGVRLWLGRFGGTKLGPATKSGTPADVATAAALRDVPKPGAGPAYPVQFGPFGLLLNTAAAAWRDSTADSRANVVDGLYVRGDWKSLSDLSVQFLASRISGGVNATSYASGEDAYGLDANIGPATGLVVGAYYVANGIANAAGFSAASAPAPNGPLWHLYGPGGGSANPPTSNCPMVAGIGIQCAALGNGYGGYVQWDVASAEGRAPPTRQFEVQQSDGVFDIVESIPEVVYKSNIRMLQAGRTPVVSLTGEYALWNDVVHEVSDVGYQFYFDFDLGVLTGVNHGLDLQLGYRNYGTNFYPPYGATTSALNVYPGNSQGARGQLVFKPFDNLKVEAAYFSGSNISNGQQISEFGMKVEYTPPQGFTVSLLAGEVRINGVEQSMYYAAKLKYEF